VDRIQQIEDYVKQSLSKVTVLDFKLAHDFSHVDRVRRWALRIARSEGFSDLALVEAAALLHDIGLAHVEQRGRHAEVGAEVAARFMRERQLFADPEVEAIARAIRCHSSPRGGGGRLVEILRDADILDALGAVGLMRAFTSRYAHREYDPGNVKGEMWGRTIDAFEKRFAEGQGVGDHIVDQVNFQISWFDNLATATARQIAGPLIEFMRTYLIQLESEVEAGRDTP